VGGSNVGSGAQSLRGAAHGPERALSTLAESEHDLDEASAGSKRRPLQFAASLLSTTADGQLLSPASEASMTAAESGHVQHLLRTWLVSKLAIVLPRPLRQRHRRRQNLGGHLTDLTGANLRSRLPARLALSLNFKHKLERPVAARPACCARQPGSIRERVSEPKWGN